MFLKDFPHKVTSVIVLLKLPAAELEINQSPYNSGKPQNILTSGGARHFM